MDFEELFYQIRDGLLICKLEPQRQTASIVAVNEAAERILAKSQAELLDQSIADFLEISPEKFKRKLADQPLKDWHENIVYKPSSNASKQFEVDFYPLAYKEAPSLMLVLRDVSYEQRHMEKLGLFRGIYNNSQESILIFNAQGKLEWMNVSMARLTGIEKHWMIGMDIDHLLDSYPQFGFWAPISNCLKAGSNWEGEVWNNQDQSLPQVLAVKVFAVKSDMIDEAHYAVAISDVTREKERDKEIEYLAYRDKLTGLYNLRYLMEQFDELSEDEAAAVYYIDLDGFTKINDTYGHFHGDRILKIIGSRLMGCLKGEEVLARVGSDKFVLYSPMPQRLTERQPENRGVELLEAFSKPIHLDERRVRITANVGYSQSPANGRQISELLKAAELASKHARPCGGNRLGGYDSAEAKKITQRYQLDHDIRSALEREELYLKFQPVIETETGEIAGFESLARWKHTTLGEISPKDFIPIAENNGVITAIGDWVLAETFSCLKTINDLRERPLYASINVSIRQLEQADFVKRTLRLMDRFKIDGKWIELEVTESVYMENIDAIFDNLKALNERGIRIAIDDFGTGYSSLSQLFRLDVSKIKIDKSFIDGLSIREECDRLTEAIALIAKSLNLELVAEGVETRAQFEQLKRLKCDYIQGYLFSKPLTLGEFCAFLKLT